MGARVAGTVFSSTVNADGSIVLENVPKGDLDLILYRSDDNILEFSSFSVSSGCNSELHVDPAFPGSQWTPHTCIRDPLGRPYVLETYIPIIDGNSQNKEEFDLRITFSHAMDALSTGEAIHGYSDNGSAETDSMWWDGGNVLFVRLCISDTTGTCISGDERFLPGVSYGITIDTTALTSLGVGFAREESVTFTP
jgi:hypothetical protein